MYGDFSRVTFRPEKHYSAVLAQQGRVQLDADANEQAAIWLHTARTTAADLVGPHGGPSGDAGFAVGHVPGNRGPDDLTIGAGRYYVDGILLDATRPAPGLPAGSGRPGDGDGGGGSGDGGSGDGPRHTGWTYWDQPDAHRDPERPGDRLPGTFPYLVALTAWERSVTAAEDPEIRESALGAAVADTAARLKTVWQVRALTTGELDLPDDADAQAAEEAFAAWARRYTTTSALLAARSERPDGADEHPCPVDPDARYRGPENQLYRVEVHRGGTAGDDDGGPTFKWSRENGSVVRPVARLDGTWAELLPAGGDGRLELEAGDWVEFADDVRTGRGEPAPLLQVEEVDLPGRRVRLSGEPGPGTGRRPEHHPFLRRWDQRAGRGRGSAGLRHGAVLLEEGVWTGLEDGVQVWFEPGGDYRPGDHWVIPARTATGAVEWPADAAGEPLLRPPAGTVRHCAPLAWVTGEGVAEDLRRVFAPLAAPLRRARGARSGRSGRSGGSGR
ncbi:DUF6519 domain-containing protein [Streptomyces sp. NPDC059506]|uniref:DUF6519 domain-containing protein n=1 Tax=Streptomyces sp. NPDC059506 TaxID=3347751 RepID=UPI003694C9B3